MVRVALRVVLLRVRPASRCVIAAGARVALRVSLLRVRPASRCVIAAAGARVALRVVLLRVRPASRGVIIAAAGARLALRVVLLRVGLLRSAAVHLASYVPTGRPRTAVSIAMASLAMVRIATAVWP